MLWRTALLALIGEVCEAMTTQQALPAIDRRSIVLGRAESHESPELKKVKTQLKNDSNIFKQFQCLAPLSWLRLWPIISCLCIYNHDSWSWFMIMINHVHFIHANNIKQPNLWHLTARHSPTKAWWRWGGGWSCWTLRGQYNTSWTQPRERQMRRDLRKQNQVT